MKKIYALCALSCALFNVGFAQFTINGNMNEAGYTVAASKQNANSCFGAAMDVSQIYVGKDAANVYIGVAGKLDQGNDNNIIILLDFSQLSGVSAGTNLSAMGLGGPFRKNFSIPMDVDYMIRMNPGSGPNCYVDVAKRVGGVATEGYFPNLGNSGIALFGENTAGNAVFSTGVDLAFSNAGSATSGFEIKIPFSAIGITSASTVKVFAAVVSADGYFSNVTVPGNVTLAANGCMAYNGTGGGAQADPLAFDATFVSAPVALPIELINFTAKSNKLPAPYERALTPLPTAIAFNLYGRH